MTSTPPTTDAPQGPDKTSPTGDSGPKRRLPKTRPQELMHQGVGEGGQRVWLNTLLSKYAVVVVAILLVIVFSVLNSSTFLTGANLQLILGGNSVALILALAGLLPLLAGEFDLSIGYTLEVSAVVTAVLANAGVPLALTLVIVIVMGGVIGLVNSFFITVLGVSSFITTLGVGTVVSAISLELTHGEILIKNIPPALVNFAQGTVAGIPLILIPAAVAFVIFYIVCEHTTYGRRLLAVGLSPRASQLAGVRVGRSVGSTFVISGVLSAIAGWLELGRVGSASAGIGPNFLLPAIAAGFLGATTIKAGRFNVLGTGVAVALVAVGIDGLQLNGAAYWVQPLFDGGVLLLAVGTAQLLARRAK